MGTRIRKTRRDCRDLAVGNLDFSRHFQPVFFNTGEKAKE
jgi:hypothetical protein